MRPRRSNHVPRPLTPTTRHRPLDDRSAPPGDRSLNASGARIASPRSGHMSVVAVILANVTDGVAVCDLYDEALGWVARLMSAVPSEMLSRDTPCPDFSVRADGSGISA